jgi:gliding motility-associated-like protein
VAETCGERVQTLELRPRFPVLELVPPGIIPPLRLCTPSDYYEFEIYNANEGRAYDVLGRVQLPSGFRILPGTSQLSYPAGNGYINLPDPQLAAGNTWQWMPEAVSTALRDNGLLGFSQSPQHALKIRFKVQAECGATSNSQPFFSTEAVLPCGIGSNVLRKPGPPILILGLSPSYVVNPALKAASALACGQTTEIEASLTADGRPEAGDSLYIQLPPSVSYVSASYTAGPNAPGGPFQIQGNTLKLPLPTTWLAGTSLSFKFKVLYNDPAGCDNKTITLATREKALANCANQNCTAFVATGETSLSLSTRNPELALRNQTLTQRNGQIQFGAVLENIGTTTALKPVVQVYYDQNGNGQIDTGEPLVGNFAQPANLNPGIIANINGVLTLPQGATICNLVAVIPATENCACTPKVYPFENRSAVTINIARCRIETVAITGDSLPGHHYRWLTTQGLSCLACVNTVYRPGASVQIGQTLTLILQDSIGYCVTERRYNISFDPTLGILTPQQTICAEETILLEATPGATSYSWSGAGAAGAVTPSVVVRPLVSTTYSVTITLQNGVCTGIGSVFIRVNKTDTTRLSKLSTCSGVPIQVLDTFTDQPGFYTRVLLNRRGCDSVLVRQLQVFPNQTQEFKGICEGDSIRLFDKWVKKAGTVCSGSLQGVSGCDSIHCVTLQLISAPQLPLPPDSIILTRGQTATLTTRPNMNSYVWTPNYNLSCTDCFNPNAKPDTSTIYKVRVEDENKCTAEASYRIVVFPPCFEAIAIPNVFTPDGDQINDYFRMVPKEGYEKVQSLEIYNRWGAKVFADSGTNPQWDGTINGQPAPTDVYIWFMTIDCRGETKKERGEVTLLR